jgi:heterodisulfide reductase subunit B
MDLAYYPGCTLHASSELYDVQCQLIFKELGVGFKELEDWNCCGATSASKTNDFLSIALPARNLGIAGSSGLKEMVIPCSSCYSRTLVSQKKMSEDPELKKSINDELALKVNGEIKVLSILDVLLGKLDVIKEKSSKSLKGLKTACYYGCLLTRFPSDIEVSDDIENPQGMETILKTLGAEPLDWGFKTDCCGASATANDLKTALVLMSRIFKDAAARGANCFVTSCPMCQLNLDAYQDSIKETSVIKELLPVYFITELVGTALGISPKNMLINRHFVESVTLLKEIEDS